MANARARWAIVAVLAVALTLVPGAGAGRAAPPMIGDWTVTRIQAGADGAYINYGWTATGKRTGQDAVVLGTVTRQSDRLTGDDVFEPDLFLVPTDGHRIRTTGLSGVEFEAWPAGRGTWAYGQGKAVILDANQSATLVSFVGGSFDTQMVLNWTLELGHATVNISHGSGTQILRQVDRLHSGIGVDAGYASAGSTVQQRYVPAGLVGGFVRVCEYCDIRWKGPDGRSGVTTIRGFSYGGYGYRERAGSKFFSGPAGSWEWQWDGVQVDPRVSSQALGAYAPVGDLWRHFEEIGDFGGTAIDWVLATVKAGPSGAPTPIVEAEGKLVRPAGNEVAFGVGRAGVSDSYVDVAGLGDDGFSTRTSDGLGSVSVEVRASPASEGPFEIDWYPAPMAANEERTLLVFAGGGVLANGRVAARSENGGSLTVTAIKQGKGSGVITPSGPGRGGTAIDADRVLAGEGEQATSVTTGIAGGLSFRCDRCTESWHSPDGRTGTFTHEDRLITSTGAGSFTFGGPAGAWRWKWSGINAEVNGGAGVIGGWAPVGADWTRFAS